MSQRTTTPPPAPARDTKMERMLMMVGWIIFAIATVLVLVVRCTDQYGFASGAALLFVYPLMLLAATATGASGSVHAYWIGVAGVVVEFLLIGSMTMLLYPGVDADGSPCAVLPGGWQLCATPDYSAIALYCGAGLVGTHRVWHRILVAPSSVQGRPRLIPPLATCMGADHPLTIRAHGCCGWFIRRAPCASRRSAHCHRPRP